MFIKNKKGVLISKDNKQYVVTLYDNLDFRIKNLRTLKQARHYCLVNNLVIKTEIC